jgi:hypothetical protein
MRKKMAIAATTDARPSSICCELVSPAGQASDDRTYKEPSPAGETAYTIHVAGDQTSEKARYSSRDWH